MEMIKKVFLASPGDVDDERKTARAAVEAVNRSVGKSLGMFLRVIGGDDVAPGAGRPQERRRLRLRQWSL